MTVNVTFPAEIEQQLQERAAATGQDVESFVRQVVTEAIADDRELNPPDEPATRKAEGLRARLEAWTALHPRLDHPIDDSREAIYAGRGE